MRPARFQAGYTLVELLVVIAIIGLVIALAAPVTANTIDAMRFRADERLIVMGFRHCQSAAINEQRTVVVNTAGDLARLPKRDSQELEASTQVHLENPISCFADGSTTGGQLRLRHGDHERTITVQWLTGSISVE